MTNFLLFLIAAFFMPWLWAVLLFFIAFELLIMALDALRNK